MAENLDTKMWRLVGRKPDFSAEGIGYRPSLADAKRPGSSGGGYGGMVGNLRAHLLPRWSLRFIRLVRLRFDIQLRSTLRDTSRAQQPQLMRCFGTMTPSRWFSQGSSGKEYCNCSGLERTGCNR